MNPASAWIISNLTKSSIILNHPAPIDFLSFEFGIIQTLVWAIQPVARTGEPDKEQNLLRLA
jgi:hypothetical protein